MTRRTHSDDTSAQALADEALGIAERIQDPWLIAWAMHLQGLAAHLRRDYAAADTLYQRSFALRSRLGHREALGILSQLMGISAHRQGDFLKASTLYREHLAAGRELGSSFHTSNVLGQFGTLAAHLGQPVRAAHLIGASAVFHESSRTRAIPLTEALVADGLQIARRMLGDAALERALAQGRAMSSADTIAEALAIDLSSTAPARHPAPQPGALTPREREVAALIARGMTNRQIAAELVVTERTAAAHVEHILGKLGFASRTQIGVWAAAQATGNPRNSAQIGASADARLRSRG
jgi:non-specific serine/threonine protein kinase